MSTNFRFDRFVLDPRDRQLRHDDVPVDLNARYLDALTLMLQDPGMLVSKDRFLEEVWRGVPVTDEALTQCIKTLRRQLGDNASAPRFIETVPKHGYRFIAPVERFDGKRTPVAETSSPLPTKWRDFLALGAAGTLGAGFAGLTGGLLYGFAGAAEPLAPGMGAASVLLVLVCVSIVAALIGGAGVSFGMAAAGLTGRSGWMPSVAGGAAGGLLVGAFGKLLGLDAFNLLFGQTPGDITGGGEGALLGAAVGLGAWLAGRLPLARGIAGAAALTGGAGLVISLLGGTLMGGSLDLLARQFPASRLRLDQIGAMFGEPAFGPISRTVTGTLEGALLGGFLVGALMLARRSLDDA